MCGVRVRGVISHGDLRELLQDIAENSEFDAVRVAAAMELLNRIEDVRGVSARRATLPLVLACLGVMLAGGVIVVVVIELALGRLLSVLS